jgi:hypothetical protein
MANFAMGPYIHNLLMPVLMLGVLLSRRARYKRCCSFPIVLASDRATRKLPIRECQLRFADHPPTLLQTRLRAAPAEYERRILEYKLGRTDRLQQLTGL